MRGRTHTWEFTLEVVRQVATGQKRPAQVCREHRLAESLLLRWREEYEERGEEGFSPKQMSGADALEAKIAELERFAGRLALANQVLKSGTAEEGSMMKGLVSAAIVVLITVTLAACGGRAPGGYDTSDPGDRGRSDTDVTASEPSDSQIDRSSPTPPASQELPSDVEQQIEALENQQEAEPGERLASNLANADAGGYTMHDFLVYVLRDVDQFWSRVWSQANLSEPFVKYAFPAPGETVRALCSKGEVSTDDSAEYCPLDDQIVVSQDFATRIWEGRVRARANRDPETGRASGDFSVAYVVAHEYAHSLQGELELIPRTVEEARNPRFPGYKVELHADCWAGVWANSAYYKGILEAGDVEEAVQTANLIGDYAFQDAGHHGTPRERQAAFMSGYNSGVPSSCDRWLTDDY